MPYVPKSLLGHIWIGTVQLTLTNWTVGSVSHQHIYDPDSAHFSGPSAVNGTLTDTSFHAMSTWTHGGDATYVGRAIEVCFVLLIGV